MKTEIVNSESGPLGRAVRDLMKHAPGAAPLAGSCISPACPVVAARENLADWRLLLPHHRAISGSDARSG